MRSLDLSTLPCLVSAECAVKVSGPGWNAWGIRTRRLYPRHSRHSPPYRKPRAGRSRLLHRSRPPRQRSNIRRQRPWVHLQHPPRQPRAYRRLADTQPSAKPRIDPADRRCLHRSCPNAVINACERWLSASRVTRRSTGLDYMATMARAATTSDVFNAIAGPQRREILVLLRAGERPVTE